MNTTTGIVLVACGGAVGALLRFWLSGVVTARFGARFPYGTLFVNTLGCFVMGVVAGLLTLHLLPADPWHDLVSEGLLGALTTFSTFSMDSFTLFRTGKWITGVCNVAISMVLCLSAVAIGYSLMLA